MALTCKTCNNPGPHCTCELTKNIEELTTLCKTLLAGADRCAEKPHFIVQPFFGIVKKHAETINKHNLFGKK